jgi:hypothetical protein
LPRPLKQLIGPLAVLAVVVVGLGVGVWAPWRSDLHERELAWLRTLAMWVEEAPAAAQTDCVAGFDRRVGPAPSDRLRPVGRIARDGCGSSASAEHWRDVEWQLLSSLISTRFVAADATEETTLALAVRDVAGQAVRVHCWPAEGWQPLTEEWGILDRDDYWGFYAFADPPRHAIHLSPEVCGPLRRFFTGPYTPHLNRESLDLAQALVMLGHDAEHVRDPYEPEAVVECYAMQGVRGFVRDAGRSSGYANELARLAWEVAYPPDAALFRTRDCRDGGRLDRHPRSSLWP